MGGDPDRQREAAARDVVWTVTQLMLGTDFYQQCVIDVNVCGERDVHFSHRQVRFHHR